MPAARLGLPLDPPWIRDALTYLVFLAGALLDLLYRRIPNVVTVPLLVAGLLVAAAAEGWSGLGWALAGAGMGLALLLVPFSLQLVRGGDVKFLAALGAWLGPLPTVAATVSGLVVGGLIAGALLVGRPALRREVAANLRGVLLGLAPAAAELQGRPRSQTVPLGAALAVGGALTFALGWGT